MCINAFWNCIYIYIYIIHAAHDMQISPDIAWHTWKSVLGYNDISAIVGIQYHTALNWAKKMLGYFEMYSMHCI